MLDKQNNSRYIIVMNKIIDTIFYWLILAPLGAIFILYMKIEYIFRSKN